jgi:hypothetical protein
MIGRQKILNHLHAMWRLAIVSKAAAAMFETLAATAETRLAPARLKWFFSHHSTSMTSSESDHTNKAAGLLHPRVPVKKWRINYHVNICQLKQQRCTMSSRHDNRPKSVFIATNSMIVLLAGLFFSPSNSHGADTMQDNSYRDLVETFTEWRQFEQAPLRDGAPDYTAERMQAVRAGIVKFRQRLAGFAIDEWPVEQQIDWHLLRAEINGLDFHVRVLQPWSRDPAYYQTVWTYQSDTPAHEGPTHHALLELWTYDFPLNNEAQQRLTADLKVIPPLLLQARGNLTGNARDLWLSGTYNMRQQITDLNKLADQLSAAEVNVELNQALQAAIAASSDFVDWLEQQADSKTGPSGVGIDDYSWHLQQVWYVPMDWADEQRLLQRELHRAWSALKLEEHRNRNLPEQQAADSPASYARLADASATRLMQFLDEQEILQVEPWMAPALREHLGEYIPPDKRNFFTIGAHLDPTPLYTHFYHWFDLARMRELPHASVLRQQPLLFNIFTSRAEGMATAFEELTMHAGLHDAYPRTREIVWILLAQRAARGLGSLQAHANQKTMTEAAEFHARWTPRQWMNRDLEQVNAGKPAGEEEGGYIDHLNLLAFEQQLYLRQPGYGSSYVTGKYQLDQMISVYARQKLEQGETFMLSEFFQEFNDAGMIPMSLIHWLLTGDRSGVDEIMAAAGEN